MSAVLEAKSRTDLKRSATRKLRVEGFVPGVLYGKKVESTPVAVENVDFIKTIREVGRNGIVELEVESTGKKHKVIAHDIQVDPLKDHIMHIDFFEVDLDAEMDADVTVSLTGEAPGEKEGGIVSHLLYNITVRAKPEDFPEEITVDISELNIGDSIQVDALKSGRNFEILGEPDETVVTVLPPQEEEDPAAEEGGEPELVGEEGAEESGEDASEDNNESNQ
ncbi:50S ribosomal protein L25/general stress protein Ctc [Bacillus sp. FJAT-44742]|uniref:50S ribosomal protein L25/general stress protein Ctc n=1 Tax=Bacillus sp. FJAT-44742 TaxID=2014005 RepID=UPI000C2369C5|nr:50S ribosomal protein L25/general stress protein Ctc [Bacillus sp. FJAT-44742]